MCSGFSVFQIFCLYAVAKHRPCRGRRLVTLYGQRVSNAPSLYARRGRHFSLFLLVYRREKGGKNKCLYERTFLSMTLMTHLPCQIYKYIYVKRHINNCARSCPFNHRYTLIPQIIWIYYNYIHIIIFGYTVYSSGFHINWLRRATLVRSNNTRGLFWRTFHSSFSSTPRLLRTRCRFSWQSVLFKVVCIKR